MAKVFKENKIVLISAIYVTAIFVAIGTTVGFHLYSCDDFWMSRIFSGKLTGTAEMMPLYTSRLFSFIMWGLYSINKNIGNFTVLQIALQWISNIIICNAFLNEAKKLGNYGILIGLTVYTFLFLSTMFVFSVNMTYSVAPAMCASAVIVLTLEQSGKEKKHSYISQVIIVLLLFFVLVMREKTSYAAVAVYMGTLIVAVIAFRMDTHEAINRAVLPVVIITLVIFSSKIINLDDKWNDAIKLEKTRGKWVDYEKLPYEGNEELYKSLGWSKAEFDLAEIYMMIDEDCSSDNFEVLNNELKTVKDSKISKIKKGIHDILFEGSVDRYLLLASLIITFTACIFCISGKNKHIIIATICYFAGFTVLFIYMIGMGRFLRHAVFVVYILALVPLTYCTFITVVENWNVSTSKIIKWLRYSSLVACVVILLYVSYREFRFAVDYSKNLWLKLEDEYIADVDSYAIDNPENVYFSVPFGCAYGDAEPLYSNNRNQPTNHLCTFGWQLQTPVFEKQLNMNGIEKMGREAFFGENVYITCSKYFSESGEYLISLIMNYIQDDYPTARIELISEEETFNILKITQ